MRIDDVPPEDARTVAATETSFRIIEVLQRRGGAGVTEVADELDLPKSTVHKHLTTLQSVNYVVKDDGGYRLGLSFLGLGLAARSNFRLVEAARAPLEKVAETTGRTASLVLSEHEYCFHVIRATPSGPEPLPFLEGERLPVYATAGGKAILAYTPEDERRRLLDRIELAALTDETITDREALAEELQSVYDRRQAYDRGEYLEGVHCIGVPITDENQRAVGAITVTIPTDDPDRQSIDPDVATYLGSTAHSVATRLRSAGGPRDEV